VCGALAQPDRVLLINPPIVDLRVPWAEWIEPTGLLKIGNLLRANGNDVRLLDCFRSAQRRKKRHGIIERDGQLLNQWSFGLNTADILRELHALQQTSWSPSHVYISTLTSFWWHGAATVSPLVRQVFPDAVITLGGYYPRHAHQHALQHGGADRLGNDTLAVEATRWPPALDLYENRITSVAVTDIADVGLDATLRAIATAVSKGATRIHLADHGIARHDPALLADILNNLARTHQRARLYVLGEISAREIVEWPELPSLLRAAGCRQLVLSDNRAYPVGIAGEEAFITDVQGATEAVVTAGFRWGTEDYTVEMCVGRLGDRPEDSARLLARLAHTAGSVIPVPYQATMQELGLDNPWETNGRLFPLAKQNDSSFMAYMELLGLCALANAKYRSRTFDFLRDDSLIAQSLRRALGTRSWDPYLAGDVNELPIIRVRHIDFINLPLMLLDSYGALERKDIRHLGTGA
jgi:hypothetical protein